MGGEFALALTTGEKVEEEWEEVEAEVERPEGAIMEGTNWTDGQVQVARSAGLPQAGIGTGAHSLAGVEGWTLAAGCQVVVGPSGGVQL